LTECKSCHGEVIGFCVIKDRIIGFTESNEQVNRLIEMIRRLALCNNFYQVSFLRLDTNIKTEIIKIKHY
jgi:hypothetical protein